MKTFLAIWIVLVALCTIAWAQAPGRPSDDEINARIAALRDQRIAADDRAALAAAQLAIALAQLEVLRKTCPPKEATEITK